MYGEREREIFYDGEFTALVFFVCRPPSLSTSTSMPGASLSHTLHMSISKCGTLWQRWEMAEPQRLPVPAPRASGFFSKSVQALRYERHLTKHTLHIFHIKTTETYKDRDDNAGDITHTTSHWGKKKTKKKTALCMLNIASYSSYWLSVYWTFFLFLQHWA